MVWLWDIWSWGIQHAGIASVSGAAVSVVAALWAFYTKRSIERLKTNLAFDLARKTKISEKEFEVLSVCWEYYQEVRGIIEKLADSIDIYNLDLESGQFAYKIKDINSCFAEFKKQFTDCKAYYKRNAIFINVDIFSSLKQIFDDMETKIPSDDNPDYDEPNALDLWIEDIKRLCDTYAKVFNTVGAVLEKNIRKALHDPK